MLSIFFFFYFSENASEESCGDSDRQNKGTPKYKRLLFFSQHALRLAVKNQSNKVKSLFVCKMQTQTLRKVVAAAVVAGGLAASVCLRTWCQPARVLGSDGKPVHQRICVMGRISGASVLLMQCLTAYVIITAPAADLNGIIQSQLLFCLTMSMVLQGAWQYRLRTGLQACAIIECFILILSNLAHCADGSNNNNDEQWWQRQQQQQSNYTPNPYHCVVREQSLIAIV